MTEPSGNNNRIKSVYYKIFLIFRKKMKKSHLEIWWIRQESYLLRSQNSDARDEALSNA